VPATQHLLLWHISDAHGKGSVRHDACAPSRVRLRSSCGDARASSVWRIAHDTDPDVVLTAARILSCEELRAPGGRSSLYITDTSQETERVPHQDGRYPYPTRCIIAGRDGSASLLGEPCQPRTAVGVLSCDAPPAPGGRFLCLLRTPQENRALPMPAVRRAGRRSAAEGPGRGSLRPGTGRLWPPSAEQLSPPMAWSCPDRRRQRPKPSGTGLSSRPTPKRLYPHRCALVRRRMARSGAPRHSMAQRSGLLPGPSRSPRRGMARAR
jgi:hypothetical protein